MRDRWWSRRALLLHLEVAIIAPGCAIAGWWQATRALAGNGLSWFYSVEWPVFAVLAIAGWWYLIHEDPEVYKARRARPRQGNDQTEVEGMMGGQLATMTGTIKTLTVERTAARLARVMAILVGLELALGILALIFVPIGRPSALVPLRGAAFFLVHAVIGLPIALGAALLLVQVRQSTRIARLSGWIGFVGVGFSALGGLMTISHPLRIGGVALMGIGTFVAGFGYLLPTFEKLS